MTVFLAQLCIFVTYIHFLFKTKHSSLFGVIGGLYLIINALVRSRILPVGSEVPEQMTVGMITVAIFAITLGDNISRLRACATSSADEDVDENIEGSTAESNFSKCQY